jgi:serine/threonine protein kinase
MSSAKEAQQTIAHYRVLERIGSGGMGEVYKAEDLKLGRRVALKLLPNDSLADEPSKLTLVDEAHRAASLNHPNIATIYELVETERQTCIAMEYVEGESLKERIRRGALPIEIALEIAVQVAEALKAAHAHGVVHCDISCSNVVVDLEGRVKVLDFGLARWVGQGVKPPADSAEDAAGTIAYMSPEQLRSEPLDGRTDIFSLGVVLYEMIAGRRPFVLTLIGAGRQEGREEHRRWSESDLTSQKQ